MRRFRIWTLWTDRAEQIGLTIFADSADDAIVQISRMGVLSGLGARRNYLGTHAQEVSHAQG